MRQALLGSSDAVGRRRTLELEQAGLARPRERGVLEHASAALASGVADGRMVAIPDSRRAQR